MPDQGCRRNGYIPNSREAYYLIGWFDDLDAMKRAYDRFQGASGLALDGPDDRPTGFRLLKQDELTPVP